MPIVFAPRPELTKKDVDEFRKAKWALMYRSDVIHTYNTSFYSLLFSGGFSRASSSTFVNLNFGLGYSRRFNRAIATIGVIGNTFLGSQSRGTDSYSIVPAVRLQFQRRVLGFSQLAYADFVPLEIGSTARPYSVNIGIGFGISRPEHPCRAKKRQLKRAFPSLF
jgi:hypothetical protein